MFLPTTPEELKKLGWDGLDVVLVTGEPLFVEKTVKGREKKKSIIAPIKKHK